MPGPWIAVHGAVLCEAGWVVQPLTDLVNLQFDPFDTDRMLDIARLFLALNTSLKELDAFYKGLGTQATLRLWPSIRRYKDNRFEYLERLLPEHRYKAVFKARTEATNELVVIKFTKSYGVDAHRLLERERLAPSLLYFSGDDKEFKKPGGLEMVVMDFISDTSDSLTLTDQGRKDVSRALELLHEAGLVFGDLRPPNILNLQKGHAMIVDFDWSGLEGQVFYPMGLNTKLQWPPGCGTAMPIQKAHDLFMYEKLSEETGDGSGDRMDVEV